MVNVFLNLSNIIIPVLIFYVVASGVIAGKEVYDDFIKGAKEGFKTVVDIAPTLVGLMIGVGILRASGFLSFLGNILGGAAEKIGIPGDLIPLIFVRLFSSSAATGLALNIFKEHGTDSYLGLLTSIIMGCTETVFYTMSVYYMAAKVKKTRFTLAGALAATIAGVAASILIANLIL